jgi:hypothetical protein
LRDIDNWLDFWQEKLGKVSVSDIEAEGALSELDRIVKLCMQQAKANTHSHNSAESFYLKRVV